MAATEAIKVTAKLYRRYFVRTLMAGAALPVVMGCAAPQQHARVHVPLPVECKESEPQRPSMPTEALAPGAAPWVLLRAALAEIGRREAYEVQLRTSLRICIAPVGSPAQ
jgi:hypothetical protein